MRRVHTTSPNQAAKTERDTLLALVFGRFRFVVTEIHIVTTLVKKRGETAAQLSGVKRTRPPLAAAAASDPKRTSCVRVNPIFSDKDHFTITQAPNAVYFRQ